MIPHCTNRLELRGFCAYPKKGAIVTGCLLKCAGVPGRILMAAKDDPIVIKKYANRRLYNTGTSTYVTLEDLADMVKTGEDFTVVDAKSGDDITRTVLTQIIFGQENKGQNLFPKTFLRQLIRFYGDSIQNLIPTYLDFSIDSLVRDQEKLLGKIANDFSPITVDVIGDQVRRNTEMFEQAMRMFLPFGSTRERSDPAPKPAEAETRSDADIEALRRQLDDVQKRLDKMSGDNKVSADKG